MADDLKRVGLIFKEEGAVDFRKTLQEINLELNKNHNQFKLTQAQWDNSTKSTEKLRSQQEYLINAIEIQTDKVNALKMQLTDLENAEEKNTTAIKKKRNELTNAEIKLKNYEKQLEKVTGKLNNFGEGITKAGKSIEKAGEKIENAGKKVSAFSAASATALGLSVKSAIDFEDAFTGVEKTVNGTEAQLAELEQGIRDMAKEIPSTTTEISAVAEAAGQLGIKTEDILSFTRVMIDLGNSTNLSATDAASALAKFANVTKMSAEDYDKLGATIVALGNNFATTEADIVEMATRLAATGELAGLSEAQILAMATAMSSVGIEAEAGGSAMSKLLKQIQVAVETGSDDLEDFAKVAGMSSKEFQEAFQEDAVNALMEFISGLNDTERNGKSAIAILEDMELKEVRLSNTILSLANASDVMSEAIDLGNEAWEDNTALTNEANKRYDTLKSKIQIAINKVKDIAITLGNKLMPSIEKIIDGFGKWIEKFNNLSEKEVDMIVNIGLIVAAIGPLITILGKVTSTIGGTVKGIGTFIQAIGVVSGSVTSTSSAVNGLASIISFITNPITLMVAGATALGAALYVVQKETNKVTSMTKEQTEAWNSQQEVLKKQQEEIQQVNKSQQDYLNSNLAEISNIEKLKNQLSSLVDENGKVKDGYEGRVRFILNELNNALGTEYSLTGNIIEKYKELSNSIDNLIAKKKANIILQSQEEKYKTAIEGQSKAIENLAIMSEQYNKDLERKNELEKESKKIQKQIDDFDITIQEGSKKLNLIKNETEAIDERIKKYKEQETVLQQYYEDIATYETNAALIASGTAEDLKKVNDSVIFNYRNRKDDTIESLKEQILFEQIALNTQKEYYKKNENEITREQIAQSKERMKVLAEELSNKTSTIEYMSPEQLDAWKCLATGSYDIYYETVSKMPSELAKKIQEMTGVTADKTPEIVEETRKMTQQVLEQIEKNSEFKMYAIDNLKGMLNGLQDNELRELLKEAGVQDVEKVMQGIRNGNLAEEQGIDILSKLYGGLNNNSWKDSIYKTARGIASNLSELLSVKATVGGASLAFTAIKKTLPGHKAGLDYVPKDNYVARLHKGERVLTAEENKEYTEAENKARSGTSTSGFIQEIDYSKMANAFLTALNKCKLALDEDGFAKIVKNELYEVL